VSFDVNHRSALWREEQARPVLKRLAGAADIVFAGAEEARLILGAPDERPAAEWARALADLGPEQVVVKRGSAGAVALVRGRLLDEPGLAVTAVDHVGAGDAFVAGYLAAHLDGATPEERLRTANMTGAFAVTVSGDWEGAPTREELALLAHGTGTVLR
jgi:2-dehydro-3-deoxygluconokinase